MILAASTPSLRFRLIPCHICTGVTSPTHLCAFDRSLSAGLYLDTLSAHTLTKTNKCARLLQELFNQIHVSHDHATAAIALAAQLIHGITGEVSNVERQKMSQRAERGLTHRRRHRQGGAGSFPRGRRLPIDNDQRLEKHGSSEKERYLATRETPHWYNHCSKGWSCKNGDADTWRLRFEWCLRRKTKSKFISLRKNTYHTRSTEQ